MKRLTAIARALLHRLLVVGGAMGLTLAFFLVLPLMQAITEPPAADLLVQGLEVASLPPPPPPPEEEPEPEPEQEEEPPQLTDSVEPLDLAQLELALGPALSGDWLGGDFAVKLSTIPAAGSGTDAETLFSLSDLDQKPRVVYQPGPLLDDKLRKKAPGTVHILFIVDQEGRVQEPRVERSTDPVFERPALAAVKQWKFEPGKRAGQAVRFRMRVPITFPKDG